MNTQKLKKICLLYILYDGNTLVIHFLYSIQDRPKTPRPLLSRSHIHAFSAKTFLSSCSSVTDESYSKKEKEKERKKTTSSSY